jgi:hypothetical protein
MAKVVHYTQADLDQVLGRIRSKLVCKLRFMQTVLGTQPATQSGLEAFVQHVRGIDPQRKDGDRKNPPTNPEFIAEVERIKKEIGERNDTPEQGEVEEKKVYGVNVVRQSEHGPYLAAHMLKAAIKQAASRLGIFEKKRGSKGDMSEVGEVFAEADSRQAKDRPWEIYLRKNGAAAKTYFDTERGTVSTPQGKKSIQYEGEHVEEGAEVEFSYHWPAKRVSEKDIVEVMAVMTAVNIGGGRSIGHGKFEVVSLTVEVADA